MGPQGPEGAVLGTNLGNVLEHKYQMFIEQRSRASQTDPSHCREASGSKRLSVHHIDCGRAVRDSQERTRNILMSCLSTK